MIAALLVNLNMIISLPLFFFAYVVRRNSLF